jgi:hypothetical protein
MVLSQLSLRILGALEEAGEDDAAALLNGCESRAGAGEEVHNLSRALGELVGAGLIVAARRRDEATRHWILLPAAISTELFEGIGTCVVWDEKGSYWRWTCADRLRAVLTETGQAAAQRLLAGDDLH